MGFIFAFVSLFVFRKIFFTSYQLSYGDMTPFPETASQALSRFFYAWQEFGYGLYRHPGSLKDIVLGVLVWIFRYGHIAQKAYIFIILILGFYSMNYLLKNIYGIKSKLIRFIISTIYVFSPIFFMEFSGGSVYSTITVFLLMPFFVAKVLELVLKPDYTKAFVLGLFIGFIFSLYSQFLILIFVQMVPFFVFDVIARKQDAIKGWLYTMISGLVTFLFNPIYFITSFNLVSTSGERSTFVNSVGSYIDEAMTTYRNIDLLKLYALVGNVKNTVFSGYGILNTIFLVLVFITVLVYLYFLINEKNYKFLYIAPLVAYVFIPIFIYVFSTGSLNDLLTKFPQLLIYRNPNKLIYANTLYFCILLGVSLYKIKPKIINKHLFYLGSIIIFTIYMSYVRYTYKPDLLFGNRESVDLDKFYYTAVEDIRDYRSNSYGRSFWVPSSNEGTINKLGWLDSQKLDFPQGLAQYGDPFYPRYLFEALENSIIFGDDSAFKELMKLGSLDSIVVLKDPTYYRTKVYDIENVLSVVEGLNVLSDTDDYTIFTLDNSYGAVSVKTNIVSVSDNVDTLLFSPVLFNNSYQSAFLFSNAGSNIYTDKLDFISAKADYFPSKNLAIDAEWNVFPRNVSAQALINDIRARGSRPRDPNSTIVNFIDERLVDLVSLSNLISKSPEGQGKNILLDVYVSGLNNFTDVMNSIPEGSYNTGFLGYLRKPFYYLDKSYMEIKENYIEDTASLDVAYVGLQEYAEKLRTQYSCGEYDYCFQFGQPNDPEELSFYFYHNKNDELENGAIEYYINGSQELQNVRSEDLLGRWLQLDTLSFNTGQNVLNIDLPLDAKDVEFKYEDSTLTINNLVVGGKYEITFDYNNKDQNLNLTVLESHLYDPESPPADLFEVSLAPSYSNTICTYIKEEKCFRTFSVIFYPNKLGNIVIQFDAQDTSDNKSIEISEIKVTERFQDAYMGIKETEKDPLKIPNVNYIKINPTEYEVNIDNIDGPFFLTLDQTFHDGWVAKVDTNWGQREINASNHYLANGFINGWYISEQYINNSNNMNITIQLRPQKLYSLSLLSTFLTISAGLYLVVSKKLSEKS